MKILAVNKFYYLKGGSETAYFSTNSILEENGHTVIPFSMQDKNNIASPYSQYFVDSIDYDSDKLTALDKIKNGLSILWSFEAQKKLRQLILIEKPDVAHLHIFQHQLTPSIIWELKKHNIPIVYTAHDSKLICPNYLMQCNGRICEDCMGKHFYNCTLKKCVKNSLVKSATATAEAYLHSILGSYNHVDRVIAPSKFLCDKLIKYRLKPDRVVNIPNFLYPDSFTPSYKSGNYILYIGRLSREKGVDTLLNAMRMINLPLKIAGTGPDEAALKQKADRLGLNDRVEFLGYQNKQELNKLISDSAFGVITSECYENYPYSVLEFMACGKPVVGSAIGGIPELIKNNETGMLFEPQNAIELSDVVNTLAANPKLIEKMGKNARKFIEKNNSPSVYYKQLLEVYKAVLKKK